MKPHPVFAALLFPVLQALVPAAGMPEEDKNKSMKNLKTASLQLETHNSASYQHDYEVKVLPG